MIPKLRGMNSVMAEGLVCTILYIWVDLQLSNDPHCSNCNWNFWAFYNLLLRSNSFLFLLIKYFGIFYVTIRTFRCPFWFTYITPSKKLCFGDNFTSFYSGITPSLTDPVWLPDTILLWSHAITPCNFLGWSIILTPGPILYMNLAGSLIIAKVTFTPESDKPNHLRTAMFTEILEAVHLPAVLLLAWFAGLARRVRLHVMCRNLGKASHGGQPGSFNQILTKFSRPPHIT